MNQAAESAGHGTDAQQFLAAAIWREAGNKNGPHREPLFDACCHSREIRP